MIQEGSSISSSQVAPGSRFTVQSTLTSNQNLNGLNVLHKLVRYTGGYSDILNYNSSGTSLVAGQARIVSRAMDVPANLTPGQYHVTVAVFSQDWQTLYQRDLGAITVVASGPTPTPTPVRSPTPEATPTPAPAGINSSRMLVSGHSLLWEPIGRNLSLVAPSLGKSYRFNQQILGGSTIKQRTRGSSPANSTQFAGYSQGFNRDWSQGLNLINEVRNPETIGGDRYDTLVVTERHDSMNVVLYEDTVRYLRHYHELVHTANSSARTFFYEPWLSHKNDKLSEWFAYEDQATVLWQCVSARVNHSLAAEGRSDRIQNIPTARALTALVRQATEGSVAGVTGVNREDTLNRLFTDDVHLTELGSYYVSLVTYAAVYGSSPSNAARPTGITASQATSLQSIAQSFMSQYRATHAPKTLAQCQTQVADVCNAFWNFDWAYANNPGQISGCRQSVTQSNQNNPFYYNATTDHNFWFPAAP